MIAATAPTAWLIVFSVDDYMFADKIGDRIGDHEPVLDVAPTGTRPRERRT